MSKWWRRGLSVKYFQLVSRSENFITFHCISACTRLFFLLIFVKNETTDDMDVNSLLSASDESLETLRRIYQGKTFKNAIKSWLPFLSKRGILDEVL